MNETELAAHFFESSKPSAALVPNLISVLDTDLFNAIVAINGAKPGVWNSPAPYDEEDRYQPFRENSALSSWALAYNQGELLALAGYSNTLVFGNDTMIVSCACDEKALAAIEAERGEQGYHELAGFPKLLQKIGWALIAVGPEKNFGLFVASEANRGYVSLLQKWCHDRGRTFYRLAMNAESPAMTTYAAPAETRARAIQEQGLQFIAKMAQFGITAEEIQTHLPVVLKAAAEHEPE